MRWISGNTDQIYFVISGKELWLAVDDHHIKTFAMVQISADLILLDGPFKGLILTIPFNERKLCFPDTV